MIIGELPSERTGFRDITIREDTLREITIREDSLREITIREDTLREITIREVTLRNIIIREDRSSTAVYIMQTNFEHTRSSSKFPQ